MNSLKLLVSVVNNTEALESIKGGAHILDVKNPKEGSLGANFPCIIRQIKEVVPKTVEVSATIGDLPNLPGTASLAALGAAVSGADYVKAGLFGVKTIEEATALMNEVCKAVKEYNNNINCGSYEESPSMIYVSSHEIECFFSIFHSWSECEQVKT